MIPVLLYHSVSENPPPGGEWGVVSPALFAAHLDEIEASGRTPITIDELAGSLRRLRPLPERPVAVTFDDGYADTYDAIELLRTRGGRGTVYVTTGEIGWPGRLSAAAIAELADLPDVQVGAHGVNHLRLDELSDDEVANEVLASKATLEDTVQGRVDSFSYPHGAYDARVRSAVTGAGYSSAAAVKNALSHRGDDPFAIARWTVTASVSHGRLAEVLNGVGVPLAWNRERLRTRAYRTVRRQRRRLFRAHARD